MVANLTNLKNIFLTLFFIIIIIIISFLFIDLFFIFYNLL